MESILEKLKLELAESKPKPGICYSDEERSFYDGISIGLEKAIDMIEEQLKRDTPITDTKTTFYNNIENISEQECLNISCSFGFGTNRNKRRKQLESYTFEPITKEEWIKRYCI